MAEMSVPRDAYLTRKLDLKERELTIREREIAIDEARLTLERDKFAWLQAQQAERESQIDGLRGMLEQFGLGPVDDDELPVSRNRGRA